MEARRKRLVYTTNVLASFARNDLELLKKHFDVHVFHFAPARKVSTPFVLLRQFLFLLRWLPGASVSVTQFAGYHSLLPVMLGRWFGVPSLVVLGGTDCVKFPSIRYGDHTRWPLGWCARRSMARATHLGPVDESLVESDYHYALNEGDPPRQGYRALFPWIRTPHTTLAYGYDEQRFKPGAAREPGSFLTVSRMSAPNFHRKGADLIFEMARRFPQCRFTLLGDTPGMQYPPVPPNLGVVRAVPYEELPAYYAKHIFYLQLSMWEGFPSAPCEAMLCGCVPIVSRVAAMPDIVGDTGFILDRKDPDMLEQIISKALTADVRSLGERARQRIIARYPRNERLKFLALVQRLAR